MLARGLRYALLCTAAVVAVLPLAIMLRISLQPVGSELSAGGLLAGGFSLAAYASLFDSPQTLSALVNSLFVGLTVTIGNVLFCFLTAYTMARHRFLPNRILFVGALVVLMIPAHIVIIPLYVLMVKSGLYDSYGALIFPWLVSPIGIFLAKQYIESIPTAMEEAARIDGASETRILFTILFPVCRPVLAVLAIQAFFTNWNSFLFPFVLTSSDSLRTLPVALALLQGHQAIDWQRLMAGATIAVAPVLLLFAILQRQLIAGLTAGAIKE